MRRNDARTERSAAAGTRERGRSRSRPGVRPNRAQLPISAAAPADAPDWARAGRKSEGKRARKEAGNPFPVPLYTISGWDEPTPHTARGKALIAPTARRSRSGARKRAPFPPSKISFLLGDWRSQSRGGKGVAIAAWGEGGGRAVTNHCRVGRYDAPVIVAADCLENRIVAVDVL